MTEIYSGIDMCHVKLSVSFGFHQGFLNVKCLSKHAGGKSSKKLIKKILSKETQDFSKLFPEDNK